MLELIEQNIVVRGALNPAIIQPNWLSKIGLIPKGEKILAKVSVGLGTQTEYSWQDNYSWLVDPLSLKVSIQPDKSLDVLTNFISKVFTQLKHTPVTATGQNFIFRGKPDEIKTDFSCKEDWKINAKDKWGTITNLKHEVTIEKTEVLKINIYLIKNIEKSTVQINFHYEASDTNQVIEYSNEIDNNFNLAKNLLQEVII